MCCTVYTQCLNRGLYKIFNLLLFCLHLLYTLRVLWNCVNIINTYLKTEAMSRDQLSYFPRHHKSVICLCLLLCLFIFFLKARAWMGIKSSVPNHLFAKHDVSKTKFVQNLFSYVTLYFASKGSLDYCFWGGIVHPANLFQIASSFWRSHCICWGLFRLFSVCVVWSSAAPYCLNILCVLRSFEAMISWHFYCSMLLFYLSNPVKS